MGIMVYSLLRVMQDLYIINRRMGFEGIFYSNSYNKEPPEPYSNRYGPYITSPNPKQSPKPYMP